ncbi:hypothetical protein G6F50_015273 [Rhizopus delemar]|uniref:Uncharacterized protein n=1 Tax=Rhizopus delemar TaxID=936053 RepID=A0A9P6XZ37_9FUNG|nr:hypothetical protein G6F50_015273 [Rhizopus delemar]
MLVTPPASAVAKPGSCGHTECSAQTLAVTGAVISLPSLCAPTPGLGYTPRCECTSISPGVTHLPWASMRVTPASACSRWPTATMRPSRSSTSALSRRWQAPVSTVAFWISTGASGCAW